MRWAIIEKAGYIGERLISDKFESETAAWKAAHELYTQEEIEEKHVDCPHWDDEGGFWSYDI